VKNNFIELNEANFGREVLNAMRPMLVEFWASWAESCTVMTQILESVAKEDAVSVKIARVNVERHESLADQYEVRAVPTLLLFNQGTLQDQIVARTTERGLRDRLGKFT
jgi:thioredoxin 1